MVAKTTRAIIVSLLLMFPLIMETSAQETMTPNKRALIKELLELTDAKKIVKDYADVLFIQMENKFVHIMRTKVIPQDVEESEQMRLIKESHARFVNRYRELYSQRMDFEQAVEEICYPLYDKHFTKDELQNMVDFYKSPTGKKVITLTPQLFRESMQKSSELLKPKVLEIVDEIVEEEKSLLTGGTE